jgi:hypothetical protein
MSKNRRREALMSGTKPPAPDLSLPAVNPASVPADYNPQGKAEQRDVVASKDGWSEYTLDDGTVLRLKAALLDAKRAVNQYGPDGNPLYVFQFTVINQLIAPKNLRKKG